jgi:hypothetical protein
MKSEEVKIRGKTFLLYERTTEDVHALINYVYKNQTNGNLPIVSALSQIQIISDSLKHSRRFLPFWERWLTKYKVPYLMKFLTQSEVIELSEKVLMLEGIDLKKKGTMTVN